MSSRSNSFARPTTARRGLPRWMAAVALTIIFLGIGLRVTNLDLKPIWEDEVYTMTRTSGYRGGYLSETLDQQLITVKDLEQYRNPNSGRTLVQTFDSLISAPEHTPFYFILLKGWTTVFGHSTTAFRSLSVLFSILNLGVFYLLGRSLFNAESNLRDAAGWGAMTLAAISPILLRYAQESRPYSLWLGIVSLSTWLLLEAWRSPTKKSWRLYGLAITVSLYTQFLTGLVIFSHGLTLGITHFTNHKKHGSLLKDWSRAILSSIVLFSPWLLMALFNMKRIRDATGWTRNPISLGELFHSWGTDFIHTWLDLPQNLESGWWIIAILCLGGTMLAITYLRRHAQRDSLLLLLSTGLIPVLTIGVADLCLGGQRSTIERYFMPTYLVLIILVGSTLGHLVYSANMRQCPKLKVGIWSGVTSLLILVLVSCIHLQRTPTWWEKADFMPPFIAAITEVQNPLIITDTSWGATLALAYNLPPTQSLFWIHPNTEFTGSDSPCLPNGKSSLLLPFPSKELQKLVTQQRSQEPDQPFREKEYKRFFIFPALSSE